MEVPFKNSKKYPHQINTRSSRELLEKIHQAREMGVDVAEVQRKAIEEAIDKVLKKLRAG
jgi:hypothetical protein